MRIECKTDECANEAVSLGMLYCNSCYTVPTHPTPNSVTGSRNNNNKAEISMILEARHAMEGISNVLTFGKNKYARGNWRIGLSHTQICDSLLRHLTAYLSGEDTDPESGLLHVDHIACNGFFLSEMTRTRKDLDDRSIIDKKAEAFLDSREAPL
jgi:hypothetical protein